jgi:hypothetical protein
MRHSPLQKRKEKQMKVKFKIKETLVKVVEVEADSVSEGLVKVTQRYANGEITIDEYNLKGFEISEARE